MLEQKERELCPYDDKRYLLADLADGKANLKTHAYGHKDIAAEKEHVADMTDRPGTEILVDRSEERLRKKQPRSRESSR